MARRAKTRRLLNKDYRAEVKAVQKAAKKRGLFASVGGCVGGALATALTGGAAAPAVAAMMAGGGNYLGRKLGSSMSKTDIKKAGGGKFAKSARNDIIRQFKQQDIVSGLKGGLFAGIGQMGGLSKILGKGKGATGAGSTKVAGEGLKQGILPKGTFSKMFKSSDPEALASQGDIGSLIDFRGSTIGQGLQKMKANSIAANAYMDNPDLLAGDLFEASGNAEELRRLTKLGKKAGFSTESIDFMSENYDPGYGDIIAQTTGTPGHTYGLVGGTLEEGAINLSRPNVPVDPGYGDWGGDIKDTIIDKDPGFTNFNEASWQEGRKRINEATKQRYWGSGSPAVEGLQEGSVGTGLTQQDETLYGGTPAMSQLGVDLSKYDLLQKSNSNRNKLSQSASRYQRLFGNRKGI